MIRDHQSLQVGLIGLGRHGAPIGRAIAESGSVLRVLCRSRESLKNLAGTPAQDCSTVAELAAGSDVVVLCVPSDEELKEVASAGLLATMRPGSVVLNHGSGSPEFAVRFADRGRAFGVHVLDAPVCGGPAAAEVRALTTLVGGDPDGFERCQSLIELYSSSVVHVGPAGTGQLARIVNHAFLGGDLDSMSQIASLGARMGFDLDGLSDLILDHRAISAFGMELPATKLANEPGLLEGRARSAILR